MGILNAGLGKTTQSHDVYMGNFSGSKKVISDSGKQCMRMTYKFHCIINMGEGEGSDDRGAISGFVWAQSKGLLLT